MLDGEEEEARGLPKVIKFYVERTENYTKPANVNNLIQITVQRGCAR